MADEILGETSFIRTSAGKYRISDTVTRDQITKTQQNIIDLQNDLTNKVQLERSTGTLIFTKVI